MIAVIAKLDIVEGKGAEFEKAMLALAAQVREKEPANHLYSLCQDDDGNYLMLELYETEADIEAHGRSDHFRAAGASFGGLIAGPPDIQRLRVVE